MDRAAVAGGDHGQPHPGRVCCQVGSLQAHLALHPGPLPQQRRPHQGPGGAPAVRRCVATPPTRALQRERRAACRARAGAPQATRRMELDPPRPPPAPAGQSVSPADLVNKMEGAPLQLVYIDAPGQTKRKPEPGALQGTGGCTRRCIIPWCAATTAATAPLGPRIGCYAPGAAPSTHPTSPRPCPGCAAAAAAQWRSCFACATCPTCCTGQRTPCPSQRRSSRTRSSRSWRTRTANCWRRTR